jgi:hypothetical protein
MPPDIITDSKVWRLQPDPKQFGRAGGKQITPVDKTPNVLKRPVDLGNAPIDAMRQATQKPAEPGRIVISALALDHVMTKHPEDAAEAVRVLQASLQTPRYYGTPQMGAAGVTVAYYYVTLDDQGRAIVLPVSTDRNKHGEYEARTFYIASAQTIARRLKKGKIFEVT